MRTRVRVRVGAGEGQRQRQGQGLDEREERGGRCERREVKKVWRKREG